MIKVNKDFENPPRILTNKNCQKMIEKALQEKKQHDFSSYYYRHEDICYKLFKILYHGKCAYCETKVIGSALRIDHYRPKVHIKENAHVGAIHPEGEPSIAMVGKNSHVPPGLIVESGAIIATDVIASDYISNLIRSEDYIQTKRQPYEV